MMRSRVDLPEPEAPIRQTNSPLSISRSTWWSASTRSPPIRNVLLTSVILRNGRRSTIVLRAPAQDVVVDRDDGPVAEEAGDADDDHAGDDEVRARQGAAVHDDGAQAGR